MTAQFEETLLFRGHKLRMCSEPLEAYFEAKGGRPDLSSNTALDRGYIGSWEIVDDRLYLTEIWGELRDPLGPADLGDFPALTIAHIFPNAGERVFAEWFTGTLRCVQGKRLRYEHIGYNSIYERDIFLEIQRGLLVSDCIRENAPPFRALPDRSDDIPDFLRQNYVDDKEDGNCTQSDKPTPDGMLPLLSEWNWEDNELEGGENDALYNQAVAIVIKHQRASIAFLRFSMHIGYRRATSLILAMQKAGIVASNQKT